MSKVEEFEQRIAEFFGAPFAVAVDCATHGIELVLRYKKVKYIRVPRHTYPSVAMLSEKLRIDRLWTENQWSDMYELYPYIWDAAVLWAPQSYISGTYMIISFQWQKHLNLSRGGAILCDKYLDGEELKKLRCDGRIPNIPWREQDIESLGYHYYMSEETAVLGLQKLPEAIEKEPKRWSFNDYPDISRFKVFNT